MPKSSKSYKKLTVFLWKKVRNPLNRGIHLLILKYNSRVFWPKLAFNRLKNLQNHYQSRSRKRCRGMKMPRAFWREIHPEYLLLLRGKIWWQIKNKRQIVLWLKLKNQTQRKLIKISSSKTPHHKHLNSSHPNHNLSRKKPANLNLIKI